MANNNKNINKNVEHPFPYKKILYTDDDIHKMMDNLKQYNYEDRIKILKRNYKIYNLLGSGKKGNIKGGFVPNELVFLGKPTILINKNSDYEDFNLLSDMFNEDCRMRCKWFSAELSPMDYWNKYYNKIVEQAKKYPITKNNSNHNHSDRKIKSGGNNKLIDISTEDGAYNLRETIYKMMNKKECTSFRPSNLVAIAKMFNSKKILDFSAGWGDRLIAAISMDDNIKYYCGVDPNPCVHHGYNEMIKFFGVDSKKYILIESPFEEAKLPARKKFDLIFTSPPYFDTEDYDPSNINGNQSLERYPSEKKWFNNFLMVSLRKCWKVLESNGHMVIIINQRDRKHQTYVKDMVMAVNCGDDFKDALYLGVISYTNEKIKNPQPMFIWRKVKRGTYPIPDTLFSSEHLYVRNFSIKDVPQMASIMDKKENMKWIANGSTKDFEQVYNMVSKYINDAYTMYPIIMKKTIKSWTEKKSEKMSDTLIGYIGYYEGKWLKHPYLRGKYLTRILIDVKYQGKGYGSEIYSTFIQWMFTQLKNVKSVYAMISAENESSISFHLKLGFKLDKKDLFFHNHKYNIYSINNN